MSGVKNHNYPKFFRGEERLRKGGYHVINPARLNKAGEEWVACLRNDLFHIVTRCDTIALLNDWYRSRGAQLELSAALCLGMKVICAHTLRPLNITLHKVFTHRRKNGRITRHRS